MRFRSWTHGCLALVLAVVASVVLAQDIAGGSDHPLIRRVPGTTLVGYAQTAHGNLDFQVSSYVDFDLKSGKRRYSTPALALDGRVTRLWYEAPGSTTADQLYQRQSKALLDQGFNVLYDSASGDSGAPDKWVNFLATFAPGKRDAIPASRSPRIFSSARSASLHTGTYQKDNTTVRLVAVDWPKAEEAVQARRGAYIAIDVVQARSLRGGPSAIPASNEQTAALQSASGHANDAAPGPAWRSTLEQSGRVALGGVEFASGSAVLQPSSQAVLTQVAEYLKARPEVRVFVVGHTDSTGDLQGNLELSRQRAQAVADALTRDADLAPGRTSAHGVGPLAPIADNATSAGRARNRRIDLVRR